MMIREKDAKYCPFCGGHSICVESKDGIWVTPKQSEAYHIGCPDCGVWYDYLFPTAEAAIEAWNFREDVSRPDLYAVGWNDAMAMISRFTGHQTIGKSEERNEIF